MGAKGPFFALASGVRGLLEGWCGPINGSRKERGLSERGYLEGLSAPVPVFSARTRDATVLSRTPGILPKPDLLVELSDGLA